MELNNPPNITCAIGLWISFPGRSPPTASGIKASAEVKAGDVIEIAFGTKSVKVRVLDLQDTTKKEEAKDLFEYIA